MNTEFVFSMLVTISSLMLTLVGLPAQIAKNRREKRSGQPLSTIIIALCFYASQIGFFVLTHAYLPLVSFLAGFILWATLLAQYVWFRRTFPPQL